MGRDFVPKSPLQVAAFFWGFSCFLPVGMSYLAAVLLIAALLIKLIQETGHRQERWQQLRRHPVFWPLCFFIAWTVLIWCVQPHYAETPSNLFHAFRIVLTIILVLMLKQAELHAGLLGWLVGAVLALLVIYVNIVIPLPKLIGIRDLLTSNGNKSISIGVMLAIFASCILLAATAQVRSKVIVGLLLCALSVLPVLIWYLPSRTSLLLIVIALLVGFFHHFYKKTKVLLLAIAVLTLVVGGVTQTPMVQHQFTRGMAQLQETKVLGTLSSEGWSESSWGVRYMLYTYTNHMVLEKPLMGWGVGSWNDQWRKRTPVAAHHINMPHNDFLWIGAQAGLVGMLALLAMMVSLFVKIVRLHSIAATCSVSATSGLLVAMSFNSALRDGQIGMSLLFVVMAINAWAWVSSDT